MHVGNDYVMRADCLGMTLLESKNQFSIFFCFKLGTRKRRY